MKKLSPSAGRTGSGNVLVDKTGSGKAVTCGMRFALAYAVSSAALISGFSFSARMTNSRRVAGASKRDADCEAAGCGAVGRVDTGCVVGPFAPGGSASVRAYLSPVRASS